MAGIDQFIQSAVQSLGVSEGAAKSGVGSLLSAVQEQADSGDFQQLLSNIPGAGDLIAGASRAAAAGGGSGSLVSGAGLAGAAASVLGGGSGSALGLLGALQGSGLSSEQLGPFVAKFIDFAKENAGQALVGKILGTVPELGKLIG